MYVYLITNQINHKKYVGITNNYKKRWNEHKNHNNSSIISKAIQKYGVENFKFELLFSNFSLEQASQKEKELIIQLNTKVPNGYNVADGGMNQNCSHQGTANGRAILTNQEVQYIKNHRDIPEYILYKEFNDKISYDTFKNIYRDKTWKHITSNTPIYPYNFEFSNQFTSNNKLGYEDIKKLRVEYQNKIYWRDAYKEYYDVFPNEWDFWNIYVGNRYKKVMPEVFTSELKHYHSSLSKQGTLNGRAKLTWEDIHKIRQMHENNIPNTEIYKMYPKVSAASIRNIINNKTWKE